MSLSERYTGHVHIVYDIPSALSSLRMEFPISLVVFFNLFICFHGWAGFGVLLLSGMRVNTFSLLPFFSLYFFSLFGLVWCIIIIERLGIILSFSAAFVYGQVGVCLDRVFISFRFYFSEFDFLEMEFGLHHSTYILAMDRTVWFGWR